MTEYGWAIRTERYIIADSVRLTRSQCIRDLMEEWNFKKDPMLAWNKFRNAGRLKCVKVQIVEVEP